MRSTNAEAIAVAIASANAKPLDLFGFLFSFFDATSSEASTWIKPNSKNEKEIATRKKKIATPLSFFKLTILLNFKISGAGCPPRIGSFCGDPGSGGLNGGDAFPAVGVNRHFVFQSQ